jgi:hypothetical protein
MPPRSYRTGTSWDISQTWGHLSALAALQIPSQLLHVHAGKYSDYTRPSRHVVERQKGIPCEFRGFFVEASVTEFWCQLGLPSPIRSATTYRAAACGEWAGRYHSLHLYYAFDV